MSGSDSIQPTSRGINEKRLTDRQRIFVHEYMADDEFNATRAAEKAGFSTPHAAASRLLKNPLVAAYLGKKLQERMWQCDCKAERVLRELMCVGFFNPLDLFDENGVMRQLTELPREVAGAIRSLKVSYSESETDDGEFTQLRNIDIQFWDKLGALQLIARHIGMLDDRIKVDHGMDLSGLLPKLIEGINRQNDDVIDADVIEKEAEK